MATSEPIDLFYSYAHKDEVLRDELAAQLSILERKGVLRSWHDRRIEGGQDWNAQIDTRLKTADLILLLVSADFIKSDYIWGNELTVAMARSASGEAAVVPVLVRPCLMDEAPFASLQGLPTDLKAVTSWPNRDEAWVDVVKGIRKVVVALQARLAAAAAAPVSPPVPSAVQVPAQASRPQRLPAEPGGFDLAALGFEPIDIAPAAASPAADPRIDAVVDSFNAVMESASQARGGVPFDAPAAAPAAHALIDRRAQSRVLWVDDRPDGNQGEMAALRKLQIEVVAVTSTAQALARIDQDTDEPFDLVLSDWARPGEADKPAGIAAGVWLLRELRRRGSALPVVFYHGEFDSKKRASRRAQAMQEGAFGEAVLPDELLQLVSAALTAA